MKRILQLLFLVAILINSTLNAKTTVSKTLSFTKENKFYHLESESIKIDEAKETSILIALPFITTWETTSPNEVVKIPLSGSYTIDWGDGTTESLTDTAEHTYTTAGSYDVSINGAATKIDFKSLPHSKDKIKDIKQWGDITWGADLSFAFQACTKLNSTATDAPNLNNVTNMKGMFNAASAFNGDLSSWDVSSVTNMSFMFFKATVFNQDISSWNFSAVNNLFLFLEDATSVSTRNYDKLLRAWDAIALSLPSDVNIGNVSTLKHCTGAKARATLVGKKGWIIDDGGLDFSSSSAFITTWETTSSNEEVQIPMSGTSTVDWGDKTKPTEETGVATHTYKAAGSYNVSINGEATRIDFESLPHSKDKIKDIKQWGDLDWEANLTGAFFECTQLNSTATDAPNLSKVTLMTSMFWGATTFNADLSSWDVSTVTDMAQMFRLAPAFNGDISSWNVSKVTSMFAMFDKATVFNRDISSWDVGAVTSMQYMFEGATKFNADISSWNVSKVVYMHYMFQDATKFNADISSWDVSKVIRMHYMFNNASSFNRNLATTANSWDVSKVTNMSSMFSGASVFNGNIASWDVSKVTNMNRIFYEASAFNQDISSWNVSVVTDMSRMFQDASVFNATISSWDVSAVTDMQFMFHKASAFNADISSWNVSNVTNMSNMFHKASVFNRDLSASSTAWNVSKVTNMSYMFQDASIFNGDISSWDVSKVNNMQWMFRGASAFNQDISSWKVSDVIKMEVMFYEASAFNQDISSWNVSNVNNMSYMFFGASAFNQDLSSWDVSNVTNMSLMFYQASAFNGNISSWDVGNVTNMFGMLASNSAFNQDLSSWDYSAVTSLNAFIQEATNLSTKNYDKLLIAWASNASLLNNVNLGNVSTLKHCAGKTAKATLVAKGWTIGDGGLSTNCNTWSGTTDTDWATASNWSSGAIPTAANAVVIPNTTKKPVIDASTIALSKDVTILKEATLTVNSPGGLTISGNLNQNGTFTINSGGSLKVNGTSTGTVIYNRNLSTTNWYLVASPFAGETIENLRTNNSLAAGSDTNIGLASYNNTLNSNRWIYQNTSSTGNINVGQGYSVKLATAGNLSFSGTLNTVSKISTITQASSNFNLVGNPFTAYLNLGDFFADNVTDGILSEASAWFWDQSSREYETKTSGVDGNFEIAPAQAFFLSAGSASAVATFDIADITHQKTDNFQKQADTRPQIKLFVKEGKNTKYTRIFYIEGTTTSFDNGYDGTIFGGANNSFQLYTHLVANNNNSGQKLGVQVLPNSDYENMLIPLGLKADAGKKVTFSSESLNLPNGIKLFLEDKETNTFTRLDQVGTNYSFTPKITLNGTGRFYLHTSNSALSVNETSVLKNITVYKLNPDTLRITGLPIGTSSIKLFNLLGKHVLNTSFESNGSYNATLPKRTAGVYIIQIENEASKLIKKIILE
ncbi:BspA family leucine-rich repeat surface protein [Polaribacter sp. IC073]|uniref:BspA family leucine-rich repeat surface protein n=1 Tax=Polaribacter sp. IC073 TaxID=2508540 RepID=UPI0011BF7220|nr:BspA family leucine-rich repeat surface protein [Polaribacter sp. IC073]TXD49049.1 BspA family leucine-rich repeat surface protein [Polaribacter sp. IC073]